MGAVEQFRRTARTDPRMTLPWICFFFLLKETIGVYTLTTIIILKGKQFSYKATD